MTNTIISVFCAVLCMGFGWCLGYASNEYRTESALRERDQIERNITLTAPKCEVVPAYVNCDCNWHVEAADAYVYDLTVPKECDK